MKQLGEHRLWHSQLARGAHSCEHFLERHNPPRYAFWYRLIADRPQASQIKWHAVHLQPTFPQPQFIIGINFGKCDVVPVKKFRKPVERVAIITRRAKIHIGFQVQNQATPIFKYSARSAHCFFLNNIVSFHLVLIFWEKVMINFRITDVILQKKSNTRHNND